MIMLFTLALAAAAPNSAAPASEPLPPAVQAEAGRRAIVEMVTSVGRIWIGLEIEKAPITACNFIRYVADGAYDGGRFHRTVRSDRPNGDPNPINVIQGEARDGDAQPGYGPIALERTRDTGLTHGVGVISMARDGPDTATQSFFIVRQTAPSLDFGGTRNPDGQGFAAFGRVFAGMNTVQAIHQSPAGDDETLDPPIEILSAELRTDFPERCGV